MGLFRRRVAVAEEIDYDAEYERTKQRLLRDHQASIEAMKSVIRSEVAAALSEEDSVVKAIEEEQ